MIMQAPSAALFRADVGHIHGARCKENWTPDRKPGHMIDIAFLVSKQRDKHIPAGKRTTHVTQRTLQKFTPAIWPRLPYYAATVSKGAASPEMPVYLLLQVTLHFDAISDVPLDGFNVPVQQ